MLHIGFLFYCSLGNWVLDIGYWIFNTLTQTPTLTLDSGLRIGSPSPDSHRESGIADPEVGARHQK